MAEAQQANGESDPDLIDDNAGENEPPAEPPPPKSKRVSGLRSRRPGLDGNFRRHGHFC